MYKKDLTEDLSLRLSSIDMDFLLELADKKNVSVSECLRRIIGEYRRYLEVFDELTRKEQV